MHCVFLICFLFAWKTVRHPSRNQKIIGEAIRRFRKRAGLSQEKLAEKADLHPVYVGELERGEEAASVNALVRVARALGVRLRDLVNDV
jgi:transcriptional regulator with XRE-family HTH domain